MYASSTTVLVK